MKNRPLLPRSAGLAGACILSAIAAAYPAQEFGDLPEATGWFVRLDAAARFNLKASMKTVPAPAAQTGIYDDGSVLPDIGGTASGMTWNWSYQSAGQVTYDAANQPQAIVLQRLANVPGAAGDINLTSPMLEGEVIGGYRFDDFNIGKHKARVGLEIGYGYLVSSSQSMDFQAIGTASRTIDAYRLWGVVPPVPPYAGTFNGPGPLIDLYADPANSSVTPFSSTTTFQGSLDTTFHNFRFGPSFGIDLSKHVNVQLSAGYDSLLADATVEYLETSAYTPQPATVRVHESKWRIGFYAEILLSVQLSRHVQLFAGGDFQHNSDFTFGDSRHEFKLELGSTYAAKGGLSFSF